MTYPLRIIATMALLAGIVAAFLPIMQRYPDVVLAGCGIVALAIMAALIVGPKNGRVE